VPLPTPIAQGIADETNALDSPLVEPAPQHKSESGSAAGPHL
jgi:hypothetical protein